MSINPKNTNKRGTVNIPLILISLGLILFLTLSFLSKTEIIIRVSFSLFLITLILGSFYIYFHFMGKTSKIRKQLTQLQILFPSALLDTLKSKYLTAYELYLKLSEKEKRNFYARINNFRETIEEYLKTQKKVELFLENAVKGDLEDQKKNFQLLMNHFQKLPTSEQEKYFSQINSIKERLERESSS